MCSGKRFFSIYTALLLHFTSTYDVLKYKGKGSFTKAKLDEKRYGKQFENWGSKFQNEKKLGNFIIANLVYGDEKFPYRQPYADAEQIYLRWMRTKESITKETEEDILKIKNTMQEHNLTFDNMIDKTPKGKLPPLLQLAIFNKINYETLVIVNNEYKNIFEVWEDMLINDPYTQDFIFKMKKYTPFVQYSKEKIQPLLTF